MVLKSYKSISFYSLNSLLPFTIMDRYLASELIPPFLFGVGAFSSIVTTIDAVFDLVRKVVESGLPVEIAVQVFLLKLPAFIVFALPMSTLLATLMTYSRLSSESELIALRGCGVSVYRMVLTAVMLSLIVTGITFVLQEQIAPAANFQATVTLQRALKSEKPIIRQQQNILLDEYKDAKQPDGSTEKVLSRLSYADKFDGRQFKGLTIVDRSQEGFSQIIEAKSAEWNPAENTWDFYEGTIYLVAPDRSYRKIVRFDRQQLQLPRTLFDLAEQTKDYNEMNIAQALQQLEILRQTGDQQKTRKLEIRIHQKMALPFVCVVFGLVGSAMGTTPTRRGNSRGTSFGVSVVVIFSYYLLIFVAGAFAQAGIISPLIGGWIPNILGISAGLLLLMQAAKR